MAYDPTNQTDEIPAEALHEYALDEIQARIEAGESPEDIAAELKVSLEGMNFRAQARGQEKARRRERLERAEAARARREELREEQQRPGRGQGRRPRHRRAPRQRGRQ